MCPTVIKTHAPASLSNFFGQVCGHDLGLRLGTRVVHSFFFFWGGGGWGLLLKAEHQKKGTLRWHYCRT